MAAGPAPQTVSAPVRVPATAAPAPAVPGAIAAATTAPASSATAATTVPATDAAVPSTGAVRRGSSRQRRPGASEPADSAASSVPDGQTAPRYSILIAR